MQAKLSRTEKKRRAAILQVARVEIQRRLANGVGKRVAPDPAPRFDDVFYEGTAQLGRAAGEPLRPERPDTSVTDDVDPLTPAQVRGLRKQIKDMDDPARFLIVSGFTRRMTLYYNVSSDTFGMNDPTMGTLFKRRAAAEVVKGLLSSGVEVLRCRVDRRGRLIKSSVPPASLARFKRFNIREAKRR
jgi:hypothetical protein